MVVREDKEMEAVREPEVIRLYREDEVVELVVKISSVQQETGAGETA